MKTKIHLKDLKNYFKNDLKVEPEHNLKACKYHLFFMH